MSYLASLQGKRESWLTGYLGADNLRGAFHGRIGSEKGRGIAEPSGQKRKLISEQALILGLHDPQYQAILNIVRSIIFLATPHRGNSMAETLNRFLKVTFSSPQKFIGELQKNATGIEDINDQFRHLATQYYIFSFFETLPSSIGPAGLNKMFVVERDSAILGYPSEIAAPLNADHRAMSKYPSQQDPNYQTVKDAIRSMVRQFRQNHLKRKYLRLCRIEVCLLTMPQASGN